MVEGRCRLLGLDADGVVVHLLHLVDRFVLAGAVVVRALVAVLIALALVAVDDVVGGKLAAGEAREVAAYLVGVVELYALMELDDVRERRVFHHLRRAGRQVGEDVLPRRLFVAGVVIELAEDGRLVRVHRPELCLVRVVAVEDDGVEADVGEGPPCVSEGAGTYVCRASYGSVGGCPRNSSSLVGEPLPLGPGLFSSLPQPTSVALASPTAPTAAPVRKRRRPIRRLFIFDQ